MLRVAHFEPLPRVPDINLLFEREVLVQGVVPRQLKNRQGPYRFPGVHIPEIAVALAPSPGIDDHIMFRKVHIVDLKTGKATNLNNPGKLGQLAWSPDGKKLAMITGADKHDPMQGRLWIRGLASEKWTDASEHIWEKGHIESVSWMPRTRFFALGHSDSLLQLAERNSLIG